MSYSAYLLLWQLPDNDENHANWYAQYGEKEEKEHLIRLANVQDWAHKHAHRRERENFRAHFNPVIRD